MRFTVTPDWKENRLLKLVLAWFLVFVALLWVTNALLYFAKMDLTTGSVIAYYRGDEARFLPPRTYLGLLEVTHFHLLGMGLLVLTMAHLLLFVPMPRSWKVWGVSLSFAAALASETAGWLVRFVAPGFAYLKIGAFVALQATLAFLLGAVLWALVTGQPNDYRGDPHDEDDDFA